MEAAWSHKLAGGGEAEKVHAGLADSLLPYLVADLNGQVWEALKRAGGWWQAEAESRSVHGHQEGGGPVEVEGPSARSQASGFLNGENLKI